MVFEFETGQNSLDVCKVIVNHNPDIAYVKLISHEVGENWRQRYDSDEERLQHMSECFEHLGPIEERVYSRDDLNALSLEDLNGLQSNHVWSVTSRVICSDLRTRHIPMMNFHNDSA